MTQTAWTLPNTDDVAVFLRARTRDANGVEQGVFGTTTRPTAAQVTEFINSASNEILAQVSHYMVDDQYDRSRYEGLMKRVIALRAAMEVEISYDPDRVGSTDNAYAALRALWSDSLKVLLQSLEGDSSGRRKWIGSVPVGGWTGESSLAAVIASTGEVIS